MTARESVITPVSIDDPVSCLVLLGSEPKLDVAEGMRRPEAWRRDEGML